MWLLIVLAVLDCFDGHVIAFMDHKYTNTWAVQINADVNEAMRMAEKYGFTYKMKVPVLIQLKPCTLVAALIYALKKVEIVMFTKWNAR